MKLKDLAFNDCVIVGFSRDAARGTLTLTFEAYAANAPIPERGLYESRENFLLSSNAKINLLWQ